MEDVRECLSVTYRRPEMFIARRWLSVYDVTLSTIYMFDVYAIFYFSFLRKEDKKLYKSILNTIYSHHKLSDEVKTRIGAHQNELKWKKLMKAGKERKDRIVQKVIVDEKNLLIHEHLFLDVAGNEKTRKSLSTGRTCNL